MRKRHDAAEHDSLLRELRAPPAMKAIAAGALFAFVSVAAVAYAVQGWSLITVVLVALVAVGVAGAADVATMRVTLLPESIVIVRNLRRRAYSRTAFVKATWAKGAPVALQRETGEWIELPPVGTSSQGTVNTLRAWLGGSRRGR
jgi:hypothetical protein